MIAREWNLCSDTSTQGVKMLNQSVNEKNPMIRFNLIKGLAVGLVIAYPLPSISSNLQPILLQPCSPSSLRQALSPHSHQE